MSAGPGAGFKNVPQSLISFLSKKLVSNLRVFTIIEVLNESWLKDQPRFGSFYLTSFDLGQMS